MTYLIPLNPKRGVRLRVGEDTTGKIFGSHYIQFRPIESVRTPSIYPVVLVRPVRSVTISRVIENLYCMVLRSDTLPENKDGKGGGAGRRIRLPTPYSRIRSGFSKTSSSFTSLCSTWPRLQIFFYENVDPESLNPLVYLSTLVIGFKGDEIKFPTSLSVPKLQFRPVRS